MTECQHCKAEVADAFLCGNCRTDTLETLTELPWWLARLTETALGHTRMADTGGRKSAARRDLDGDAELAACIEALPDCDDLDKARRARQKAALAHALATGGINARASDLLAEIDDTLGYWCRVLCEERGIDYHPDRAGTAGANHARWLAAHADTIALSADASDITADILGRDKRRRGLIDQIEHVINRRWRWWPLGECPTPVRVEGPAPVGRPRPTTDCGVQLRAREDATTIRCPGCRTLHHVHRLLWARKSQAEAEPMTARQLTRYNHDLPPEFQVPPRTLRHWLATGRLCPCAELAGDPLYSWVDVRLLMLRKPQTMTTGAAARRNA